MAWAWGHGLTLCWLVRKLQPCLQEKFWKGVWPGRHSVASAVEPGCGWTHRRILWEWLSYTGVCWWHCYPHPRNILKTVSKLLQEAVSMVQQWCDRTQLSINPQKMMIVPFTRKRDLKGLKLPTLSRNTLQPTTEVEYLGLILHKGLTWMTQFK